MSSRPMTIDLLAEDIEGLERKRRQRPISGRCRVLFRRPVISRNGIQVPQSELLQRALPLPFIMLAAKRRLSLQRDCRVTKKPTLG